MDEIEYKLKTNNSILVVNAIEKLIRTIKSKFKPADRPKFILENEELKFLREKCSSKDTVVSLTACQGLLALVEAGVLQIGHTMSTVITLLPTAHNYSAIISTMAGLLILDLKSRLTPGQQYISQFSLRSPQHPFITVMEKRKEAAVDILTQMHSLCTHPDYIDRSHLVSKKLPVSGDNVLPQLNLKVSSNSLELLLPVFLWLTCNPHLERTPDVWPVLLAVQNSRQPDLLIECLSWQQTSDPRQTSATFAAYSCVTETMIYQQQREYVMAIPSILARVTNELVRHGQDPRPCYHLIEKCFTMELPELRTTSGLTLAILADNLPLSCALHLHELFLLSLNIITRYEYESISLSIFVAQSLQWLHLPSSLTTNALKVAAKILETHRTRSKEDARPNMSNLHSNKTFQSLLYTDRTLSIKFKLFKTWECIKDDPAKLRSWFDNIESVDADMQLDLVAFLLGVVLERRNNAFYEDIALRALKIVVNLVDVRKELSIQLLPILLYKIANDVTPRMKMECLKALPLMAKTKENVPTIVGVLNKLRINNTVPLSFLISLYTTLTEIQVRCFPYLQELLADSTTKSKHDVKSEIDIAKATAVKRICESRPHLGVELVGVISSLLGGGGSGPVAAARGALTALGALWRDGRVAPLSAWVALQPRLDADTRDLVQERGGIRADESPSVKQQPSSMDICNTGDITDALPIDLREGDEKEKEGLRLRHSHKPDEIQQQKINCYFTVCQLLETLSEVSGPGSGSGTGTGTGTGSGSGTEAAWSGAWRRLSGGRTAAAACRVIAVARTGPLKDVPEIYRQTIKLPAAYCKTPEDAARNPEDVLDYIPCEVWPEVFKYTSEDALEGVKYMASRLIEQELRSFRSGVYQTGPEPQTMAYLPPHSVLRGITTYLRKQLTSPRYDCPPGALVSMLETISLPYTKPLPPMEVGYLRAAWSLAGRCRAAALRVAAGRGPTPAAVALLRQHLAAVHQDALESDILIFFEVLPLLARNMPSDSLRGPIENCLNSAFKDIRHFKLKDVKPDQIEELLFVKLMRLLKVCLDCDKINDVNRNMISQIVESYWNDIGEDSVAWSSYLLTCSSLPASSLRRLTEGEGGRRAWRLRSQRARGGDLTWLDHVVDTAAQQHCDQAYVLGCVSETLRVATSSDETRQWLMQLLARTQVAFTESEDESSNTFLWDVFSLGVLVMSGHWTLEAPGTGTEGEGEGGGGAPLCRERAPRDALFPAALSSLLLRDNWKDYTPQVLECVNKSSRARLASGAALSCRRAVKCLRGTTHFRQDLWLRAVKDGVLQ